MRHIWVEIVGGPRTLGSKKRVVLQRSRLEAGGLDSSFDQAGCYSSFVPIGPAIAQFFFGGATAFSRGSYGNGNVAATVRRIVGNEVSGGASFRTSMAACRYYWTS